MNWCRPSRVISDKSPTLHVGVHDIKRCHNFSPGVVFSGLSFSPFINTCFTRCNISVLGRFWRNLAQIFVIWLGIAEKVFGGQRSRSCSDQLTRYGGGVHFDDLASRLSCLYFVEKSRDNWKLFRRLFLVDNISGRRDVSSAGKHEYHWIYNYHMGICPTMQIILVF